MSKIYYTFCSFCGTRFKVDPDQLVSSQGKAHCCECDQVFNALENLWEEDGEDAPPPTAAGVQDTPDHRWPTYSDTWQDLDDAIEPRIPLSSAEPAPPPEPIAPEAPPPPRPAAAPRPVTAPPKADLRFEAPVSPREAAPSAAPIAPGPARQGFWWLAAGLLSLAIPAQLFFGGHKLLSIPLFWYLSQALCTPVGCQPQPPRLEHRLSIRETRTKGNPRHPGALLLNAALHNQAPVPQPFPVLQLGFYDKQDRLVAARRFQPHEYLQGHRMRWLDAQSSLMLNFEFIDPGPLVTTFKFEIY